MGDREPTWQAIQGFYLFVAALFAVSAATGCGGGSSSSTIPPPPPSFTIIATPSVVSIAPGTSSTLQVTISEQNGFGGTVTVTSTGLPVGLSLTPSSFSATSSPQTVTLAAANSLVTGNYSFQLSGVSGNTTSSTTVDVAAESLQGFVLVQPLITEIVTRFGGTTQVQLQTLPTGSGISNYQINFSMAGLQSGVTATFSPNSITAGSSTTLTVTAPASGQWIQNMPVTVLATPTARVASQTIALDLVVAPPPGSIPPNRTSYLRTDDTPKSIVYDPVHQLLFSSDYLLNRVDVISTATRQIVKSVPVMTPLGLAMTLDGSQVLVGSDAQQVVAIGTTSLQIDEEWKLPRLSGASYATYGPERLYPLSTGEVGIQLIGLDGGLEEFEVWDPTTNAMSAVNLQTGAANDFCFAATTSNGATVLLADCTTETVAEYDVAAGTFRSQTSFPTDDYILGVATSPDGSRFVISTAYDGILLYNSQLGWLSTLAPPGYYSGFIFSPDSDNIYLATGGGIMAIFNATTGIFVSAANALYTIPPGAQTSPFPTETPFAIDATGIIFGSADHGVAFDDSTYSVNFVFGFNGPPGFDLLPAPSSGPLNVSTATSFQQFIGFDAVPDVWFGNTPATQETLAPGLAGSLSATAPPSNQPGPVSVKIIEPDGTQLFNPLVFSYGPSPMFVSGDTATPNGGVTTDIIGVGLPTDPTQIQVAVGGRDANVLSAAPGNFYGIFFPNVYPYPSVDVKVTLPTGTGDQDLTVTTASGAATIVKAIHYAQSVTDYSSPDTFRAILLDRKRNQLYLSAGDHIDVFSIATRQFLAPFTPPALNGQKDFHGMALTPDGSELLATNFLDGSVALINPDSPGTSQAVQVIPTGTVGSPGPENVVTTNAGHAFIEPFSSQSVGCGASFYDLSLSTLNVATVTYVGTFCIQPEGFPIAASGDGSKALLLTSDISGPQEVAIYDSASSTWSENYAVLENFGANAGVSLNGSAFVTGSGIVDSTTDLRGYLSWQDTFEANVGFSLPLEKIPDGGSLVYVPYPAFVDIFDTNHGHLLHRLSLSEQVQKVTDAMAIDGYGQNIYLITNAGLTIAQLSNAPLAIGSLAPSFGPVGTSVVIHGSGFQSGTSVTANGLVAATSFVDANTLKVTMPSVAPGPVQVILTNTSGESYTLDNAFIAQ